MSRINRTTYQFACIVAATLVFAGCNEKSTEPNDVITLDGGDGHFHDSAVQGLDYSSGTVAGLTSANGKFLYEKNMDVAFAVGDIDIGSAPTACVITPLHLVLGAVDVTNPTVTNMARFLQTIDNDANPANGIVITTAVRTAAAGQAINFQQDINSFENDANVQAVVSALTTATAAGERALISAATAQSNLSSGIRAAYEGSYEGDFCRNSGETQVNGGTWLMDVEADGSVSIGFDGNPFFVATGTMDMFGNVTATGGGAQVIVSFAPEVGGTWTFGELSGTFSEETDCSH